jgi:mRNA interferase MazF
MLPEIGDVAWVEFDPVISTEQAGRRPALVLSDRTYHVSRRAIVCPISICARPWAFNVPLPHGMITSGMVLVDQIRTIDRTQRMFKIIEHAPDAVIAGVRGRLAALLRLENISLLPDQ